MKKQGRSPVIAVRVPEPLHRRIKASARTAKQSMSEHMAILLGRAFDWQDAFGDRVQMLEACKAETARIEQDHLTVTLKRKGWKRQHDTGAWLPPEVHGLPPSGFIDEQAERQLNHDLEVAIERVVERAVRKALTEDAGEALRTVLTKAEAAKPEGVK